MGRNVRRAVDGAKGEDARTRRCVIIGRCVVRQCQTFRAAEFFRFKLLKLPSISSGCPLRTSYARLEKVPNADWSFHSRSNSDFKFARKWDATVPNPGLPTELWPIRQRRAKPSNWRHRGDLNFPSTTLRLTTLKFDSLLASDKLSSITMPISKQPQTSGPICPLCNVRRPKAGRKFCTTCREIECERLIERSHLEEAQALKSIEAMCDPR